MSIPSKSFDKNYYYNICLGSDEFKKSKGHDIHPQLKKLIDLMGLTKDMSILDVGCGRGDLDLYIAKRVKEVIGIDYSKDGIAIANTIKKSYPKEIKNKCSFLVMDAADLKFNDNTFDMIILIDILDHLTTTEQQKLFTEITRVLKKDGKIFIHTCANKILLSKVFPIYTLPVNKLLTFIDRSIKGEDYASLPSSPRSKEQEEQHINESDYFSIKKLYEKFNFSGKTYAEVGFIKEPGGLRANLYNFLIAFYPFSKYFPLSILFASSFTYRLTLKK